MREWGLPGLAALHATHSILWQRCWTQAGLCLTRRSARRVVEETTGSKDATKTLLAPHLLLVRALFEARSRPWLPSSSLVRPRRLDDIRPYPHCRQKEAYPIRQAKFEHRAVWLHHTAIAGGRLTSSPALPMKPVAHRRGYKSTLHMISSNMIIVHREWSSRLACGRKNVVTPHCIATGGWVCSYRAAL